MDTRLLEQEILRRRARAVRFLTQSAMHLGQVVPYLKYPYFWLEFRTFLRLSAIAAVRRLRLKLAGLLQSVFGSYFGCGCDSANDLKSTPEKFKTKTNTVPTPQPVAAVLSKG
jgi:hypothetical protein